MTTPIDEREHKISEGLRKLEEFQRRRSQQSQIGHVAIQRPASLNNFREPRTTPVSVANNMLPQSSSNFSPVINSTVMGSCAGSAFSSGAGLFELTSKLQRLVERLSGSSQVTENIPANGLTPSMFDDLQRQCSEIIREATLIQNERDFLRGKLESIQNSYVQAAKTIDLLVAEKSRMKSSADVLEAQLRAKTHVVEVQESEVRSLRERATVNEGQMQALRAECERFQDSSLQSSSCEVVTSYKKRIEDLTEQQKQAAEKIHQMEKAYEQTRQRLDSTAKELSVAQAYIRQLSGGVEDPLTNVTSSSEIESLREEMAILLSEKSSAELISRNLEASNRGLQDRVAQLSQELRQMKVASSVPAETSSAVSVVPLPQRSSVEIQCEFESESHSSAKRLEAENDALKTQLESAKRLADQYCQQLENLQAQLTATSEQLHRAKLDSSRACVQNRDLKSQLEELQDVFVKLSNEKLDLTEELATERHRVQQLTNERNRNNYLPPAVSKNSLPQPAVSQTVAEWTERYNNLERQHSTCRDTIARLQSKLAVKASGNPSPTSIGDAKVQTDSPNVSISEYEFVEQTSEHSIMMPAEHDSDTENTSTSSADSTSLCRNTTQFASDRRVALQAELKQALQRIEILEDQKNYLEHQVVQLQMETDTISDYIQLYQQQRAALNRHQQDKEAQMNQLLSDREELRGKVSQLQALVSRLVPISSMEGAPKKPIDAASADDREITKEVLAREIFNTLEDINQASASVSFDNFKCTSCHGCQGKLISL